MKYEEKNNTILFYSRKGKYGFFSNYYFSPIVINSIEYPTLEHYYQASKSDNLIDHLKIASVSTPEEAKELSKGVSIKTNWDTIKIPIMYRCIHAKFTQNNKLRDKLIKTKGKVIIEHGPDKFWGHDGQDGNNYLGRILMMVRDQMIGYMSTNSDTELHKIIFKTNISGYISAAEIRKNQFDEKQFFFHLLREEIDVEDKFIQVLKNGILHPKSRYNPYPVTCFSLTTLSTLKKKIYGKEELIRRVEKLNLYSGFGFAIPYEYGREIGITPVISISPSEVDMLNEELKYRVQFYSSDLCFDWTHENEWRLNKLIDLNRNVFVIVPNRRLIKKIKSIVGNEFHYINLK
ncbi:MAG: NADAR family protein [Chitinophagales bacterium]|nr:NADAR family protein [Chitinophagales bacterium]